MSPVYHLWNEGLGDHWASISLLAHMSAAQDEPLYFHSKPQHQERHRQILRAIDLKPGSVLPLTDPGDRQLNGFHVWATEYVPTRQRWRRPTGGSFVCTHFAGISSAEDKNPPAHDVDMIRHWAQSRGLATVELGAAFTIERMVDLLARCALFVGCDSGVSHIAHSVGCPTYLLEYKLPVVTCHRHKNYVRCDGAAHFVAQAGNWLDYLDMLLALSQPE